MSYHEIPAQDVRVGDQIFLDIAANKNHCWCDVKKTRVISGYSGKLIAINAGGRDSLFSLSDTVTVQRFDGLADRT